MSDELDKLLGGITEDNRHPEFPPMTSIQEEIPAKLLAEAHELNMRVRLMSTLEQQAEALAAALIAERNRTVEECAGIAADDDGHFSQYGEDRNTRVAQQTCRDAAAAIRALLK